MDILIYTFYLYLWPILMKPFYEKRPLLSIEQML